MHAPTLADFLHPAFKRPITGKRPTFSTDRNKLDRSVPPRDQERLDRQAEFGTNRGERRFTLAMPVTVRSTAESTIARVCESGFDVTTCWMLSRS